MNQLTQEDLNWFKISDEKTIIVNRICEVIEAQIKEQHYSSIDHIRGELAEKFHFKEDPNLVTIAIAKLTGSIKYSYMMPFDKLTSIGVQLNPNYELHKSNIELNRKLKNNHILIVLSTIVAAAFTAVVAITATIELCRDNQRDTLQQKLDTQIQINTQEQQKSEQLKSQIHLLEDSLEMMRDTSSLYIRKSE